jgi:thiol-disulfide isomerase/thioredoxin
MRIFYKTLVIFAGLFFLCTRTQAEIVKGSLLTSLRRIILPNAEGKDDNLNTIEHHKATVFVFLSSECPISNSYMPMLADLSMKFGSKDIAFYGVMSDPYMKRDEAKKFSSEYKFPADILVDSKQQLATLLKAHITPEVFVISHTGAIEYHGRIDDRFVALGKGRMKALHNDLHDALINITEGKKVKNRETKVIGCWIPQLQK